MRDYSDRKNYYFFNNPFTVDCVSPACNPLPMPLDKIYKEKKTAILQISFHIPFRLPLENLLVICLPLLTPHKLLS